MLQSDFLFDLADLPPIFKYEKLFENLPMLKENIPKTERLIRVGKEYPSKSGKNEILIGD